MKRIDSSIYRLAFSITLSVIICSAVHSSELRPLNLPSTQQQYSAPTQVYVTPVQPEQPAVYNRFREVSRGLNESEKEEYRKQYQKSLSVAQSRGDQAAVTYYQELLNILNE
jgi:hypothetical protein